MLGKARGGRSSAALTSAEVRIPGSARMSGTLHGNDAAGIRVCARAGVGRLFAAAQQLQHLRQRRHGLVIRPGGNLLQRQAKQLGQGGVGGEAQALAQRALCHPAMCQAGAAMYQAAGGSSEHSARAGLLGSGALGRFFGRAENIGPAQPPDFRYPPVLPVLDSLRPTARVYAELTRNFRRAAEAVDQITIGVKFGLHASHYTSRVAKSQHAACNTSRLLCVTLPS